MKRFPWTGPEKTIGPETIGPGKQVQDTKSRGVAVLLTVHTGLGAFL